MKQLLVFSLALTTGIYFGGCNGDDCEAGDGGSLTIVATLKHHTMVIPNQTTYSDSVFVKFNADELPGTQASDYDKIFVGEAGEDHVHLAGLKCGDYYLYAVGYDTTINERVTGGIPFSTDVESGEVDVNIPVTE